MRINKILKELIIIFLQMENGKRLELNLDDNRSVIYDVSTHNGLYCNNDIIDYNDKYDAFFLLHSGINTLESNILFKKILKKDNIFKEELISILEKELLNEN